MSKYVYDENLKYLDTFFDEIEDKDILSVYTKAYITNEFIEYPKLENGNIKSMSDNEISQIKYKKYLNKEYELQSNEVIDNDMIISVELKEFEYIENGVLKFNADAKKEQLINKTKTYEEAEKERDFEYKGYLQPNRELEDQTSLLKILSFMQLTRQTHFDKWKMKDKEGHEHYIILTIQEMMELGQIMQTQTTKAMIKWSTIREKIKAMSKEEIKVYELSKE